MVSKELVVKNQSGIHARPAAVIVKTTSKFQSDVSFIKDDIHANAKSIMNILLLAVEPGSHIIVEAEGPDEDEALGAMIKLFESDFHDETEQTF